MTFNQAKKKLDNMTERQHDKLQVILTNLHGKIKSKQIANAIELASMALMLYTKGGK